MYSFKALKLTMLMTNIKLLAIVTIAAFGIIACQSAGQNQIKQSEPQTSTPIESAQTNAETDSSSDQSEPSNEYDVEGEIVFESSGNSTDDDVHSRSSLTGGDLHNLSGSNPSSQHPNGLNPNKVKESLIEINNALQSACHPEPGTLKVSFMIHKTGDLLNVESTGGTLRESNDEKCLLQHLSEHHFQPFDDNDIPVRYQFKFK